MYSDIPNTIPYSTLLEALRKKKEGKGVKRKGVKKEALKKKKSTKPDKHLVFERMNPMTIAECETIAEVARTFQRRKVCDVNEVRHKLPGWTCEIDDDDEYNESDWSLSTSVDIGGTTYRVTLEYDNPKRLYVNVSTPEHRYRCIGKSWSWSIFSEELECYVSDWPGYDTLPESTKTWLNELNHIFDGKE